MYRVELIREDQSGRGPVIEFYTVPIRGRDDGVMPAADVFEPF